MESRDRGCVWRGKGGRRRKQEEEAEKFPSDDHIPLLFRLLNPTKNVVLAVPWPTEGREGGREAMGAKKTRERTAGWRDGRGDYGVYKVFSSRQPKTRGHITRRNETSRPFKTLHHSIQRPRRKEHFLYIYISEALNRHEREREREGV